MIAKKVVGIVFLSIFLLFGTNAAFAAPFFPGEIQLLEDADAEILLNSDGSIKSIDDSTVIAAGDLFAGAIKVQLTENVPSGDNSTSLQGDDTFTALFLIKATSVTAAGDGIIGSIDSSIDTLNFGAASLAEWKSVFGAGEVLDISSYLDLDNLDGSGTGLATDTMTLVFDGIDFGDADFEHSGGLAASAGSFVDGGNLLYEFGLTGAADEFWFTKGEDAAFPGLVGTNNPTNRLSLNVTKYWGGPELLPHNFLGTNGNDLNFTGPAQLQGKGDFAGTSDVWPLGTDTDLYWNAVPEPATLMLFGIGLLGIAGVSRRRSS